MAYAIINAMSKSPPPVNPMVPFLIDLESPFDGDRALSYDPFDLVRFALKASDYWAARALDWLTFGLDVDPVSSDLRELADDGSRPQSLRHRALRILREHRDA